MPKLKALRSQVGSYGHVRTNGIIDPDEAQAKKLIAKGQFVRATDADIAAAQERLGKFVDVSSQHQVKGAKSSTTASKAGAEK